MTEFNDGGGEEVGFKVKSVSMVGVRVLVKENSAAGECYHIISMSVWRLGSQYFLILLF